MSEVNEHDALAVEVVRDGVSINEFGVRVKRHLGWDEYLDKLVSKDRYEDDTEKPDPRPMQPPVGFIRQPSMVDHIRAMVRSEQLRLAAELEGYETFEDAEDFDVDGDLEPWSAYEVEDDLPSVAELRRRLADAERAEAARAVQPMNPEGSSPASPAVPAGPPEPS